MVTQIELLALSCRAQFIGNGSSTMPALHGILLQKVEVLFVRFGKSETMRRLNVRASLLRSIAPMFASLPSRDE